MYVCFGGGMYGVYVYVCVWCVVCMCGRGVCMCSVGICCAVGECGVCVVCMVCVLYMCGM